MLIYSINLSITDVNPDNLKKNLFYSKLYKNIKMLR